jgi:hypothetical protein
MPLWRERCHYEGRDAALWKYPLDSRIKLSKWKRLIFIQMKQFQH